jgi:hypothetical protein
MLNFIIFLHWLLRKNLFVRMHRYLVSIVFVCFEYNEIRLCYSMCYVYFLISKIITSLY